MKFQKKNRIFACALCLALLMASVATSISAFADSNDAFTVAHPLKGMAIVKAPLNNNQLLVIVNEMEVALNISDETLIIDSKTGLPATLDDLIVDDVIFVYYSAAMTRSLPPQSHAVAIVTQVEKDKNHAELFTIKEIISRNDGEVRALNKEGDLIVTFIEDQPLTPFKTKQIVTLDDITVGTQLFIWYEIVALSYPGQTGATKAVLVGQEEGLGVRAVYTPFAGLDMATITIKDKTIQLDNRNLVSEHDLVMLPLRAVAEGLGFNVTWNGEQQSIDLDDGSVKTTLHIGTDSYYKSSSTALGLTQNFNLGASPMLIDSTTYVPASLFNLLYSDNNTVKVTIDQK